MSSTSHMLTIFNPLCHPVKPRRHRELKQRMVKSLFWNPKRVRATRPRWNRTAWPQRSHSEHHPGSGNGCLSQKLTGFKIWIPLSDCFPARPTNCNWITQLESEKQGSANGRNNELIKLLRKNNIVFQGNSYKQVLFEDKNSKVRQSIENMIFAFRA